MIENEYRKRLVINIYVHMTGFIAVKDVSQQSYDNVCSPQQFSPVQRTSNFSSPRPELDRSRYLVSPLLRTEAK